MAGARRPITYEIAKTYIENNPQRGSKTIARMLCQDEPEVFSSIEQARSVVRKIRGNAGTSSRKYGDKSLKKPNAKPGQFQVPQGVRQGQPPVQVDWGRYLLLSDLHVPYHDEQLVEIALTIALEKGCNGIYLNGDSIDFYKLSRFIQDPRMRSARRERDTLHEILACRSRLVAGPVPRGGWPKRR